MSLERKLSIPFANTGLKTPIPLEMQSDGGISFEKGHTPLYAKPKKQNGIQLKFKQYNQLFYDVTSDVIENSKDINTIKESIASLNENGAKTLTKNINFSVGPGGDYDNLQDAINEAQKYVSGYEITLTIKDGYTITSRCIISSISNTILITGENDKNTIVKVNLNSTGWGVWGILISRCSNVSISNITFECETSCNSIIYIERASVLISQMVLKSKGVGCIAGELSNVLFDDISLESLELPADGSEYADMSFSASTILLHGNIKFKTNDVNKKQAVAMQFSTATNAAFTFWNTGSAIEGTYKAGIRVNNAIVYNGALQIIGSCATKYSQTPGQFTPSGFISVNN
ncbi:hypothetical protein [Campylobacter sp.]|uniref:hypothetical protein n=1 Tax=Campylobacter sp. TaxID=205 RepID=UPI0025C1FD76|nr:hypothetical protein [Campylobacter sp.]